MKKLLIFLGFMAVILTACGQAGNVRGYKVTAIDTLVLNEERIVFDTTDIFDGQSIVRVGGIWTNDTISGGGAGAVDSFSVDTVGIITWGYGSPVDTVPLPDYYLLLKDSGLTYVTPPQLDEIEAGARQDVYTVSLPPSTTVAGRIAAAVEGTDYPTGWQLSALPTATDLTIVHDMERHVAAVNIYALMPGGYHQLLMNTAAYNGIQSQSNAFGIFSLATVNLRIYIEIIFTGHGD